MSSPEPPPVPTSDWPYLLGRVVAGHDLTRTEAAAAMTDILSGAVSPVRIAGLIVALGAKGETAEELTGMVNAMRAAAEPLAAPEAAIDIVGTGGSDHRRQHALNVSTMACFVAGAAGAVVCKHGNRRASSTSGSFDFLEAIGLRAELSPSELGSCLTTTGLGFAFARTFHPAMRHAAPVRAELGIPTVFNVLGPLANPGGVSRYLLGTSTPELASKMAGVLANLGSAHSWVVSGAGGIDELTVSGPSVVYEVIAGRVRSFDLDPASVGMGSARSLDEVAGGTPGDNAKVFEAILDGSLVGPKRDIVVLNAGAGLVVAGLADDLAQGIVLAVAAIDDGRAAAKVAQMVQVTNNLGAL